MTCRHAILLLPASALCVLPCLLIMQTSSLFTQIFWTPTTTTMSTKDIKGSVALIRYIIGILSGWGCVLADITVQYQCHLNILIVDFHFFCICTSQRANSLKVDTISGHALVVKSCIATHFCISVYFCVFYVLMSKISILRLFGEK